MNKFLFLIAILLFFNGCDETVNSSTENPVMESMVGTWNTQSSTMDMTTDLDFNTAFLYMYDQENCIGTWEDEDGDGYGCMVSDEMTSVLAPLTCNQLQGVIIDNVCTYSLQEVICCEELESSTLTISLDGSVTMLNINSEEENTETGTISFEGTDITWIMADSQELNGTLSTSGDSLATFTFEIDNAMDILLDDEEADQSYIDAIEAGAISISATMSMIMERLSY